MKRRDFMNLATAALELELNLKTAKAMGWTIPPAIVATADEVIEQ